MSVHDSLTRRAFSVSLSHYTCFYVPRILANPLPLVFDSAYGELTSLPNQMEKDLKNNQTLLILATGAWVDYRRSYD